MKVFRHATSCFLACLLAYHIVRTLYTCQMRPFDMHIIPRRFGRRFGMRIERTMKDGKSAAQNCGKS